MVNPLSPIHLKMNIAYSVNTVLTSVLTYQSYKENVKIVFTLYPAFILFMIRMIIRVFDIESTKEDLGMEEWVNIYAV